VPGTRVIINTFLTLSVTNKIFIGFSTLAVVFAVFGIFIYSHSESLLKKQSEDLTPSIFVLKEYRQLITELDVYLLNMVYNPNWPDKKRIVRIKSQGFPHIRHFALLISPGSRCFPHPWSHSSPRATFWQ
jgi:hypothetical protein